jgi:hypothetical protein
MFVDGFVANQISQGAIQFGASLLLPGPKVLRGGKTTSICDELAATGAFNPKFSGGGQGLGVLAGKEVRVSQRGLELVEKHLGQFGQVEENAMMLDRIRGALTSGQKITGGDAVFYIHEAAEATMMSNGMTYGAAHAAALERYAVSPFSVYPPEVIQALPNSFNENWFKFWGIPIPKGP